MRAFHLTHFPAALIVRGLLILLIIASSGGLLAPTTGSRSAVGILPPSTSLNVFPGGSGSYELRIHSGETHPVTVRLSVVVSTVPLHGSASDIMLSFPSTLSIKSGNTVATVTVTVKPSAVPGIYILTDTLSEAP